MEHAKRLKEQVRKVRQQRKNAARDAVAAAKRKLHREGKGLR